MSKQIAQELTNRLHMQAAMIAPQYAAAVGDVLRNFASASRDKEDADAAAARVELLASYGYPSETEEKPFAYADGVAFIPVSGLLINRFSRSWGWVTGYNFIRSQLNAALEDDDVNLIVYDCNSGGGEVAGCFELSNDIFASRAVKPSVGVIDSACYSACYAVASAASKLIIAPSGGAGSIGVLAMHVSYEKMLKEAGLAVTFIYSGDHKVDGNPYQALPSSVRASIQARVDGLRKEFVDLVARNRGCDPQVVHDTQAQCYSAEDALRLGLVDAVAPPTSAVQAFLNELSESGNTKENHMSKAATPGAENQTASTAAPAAAETASTEATATQAAAEPAKVDVAAEREAERTRIAGITGHEAAKGKSALANHLALKTDLSVEDAAKILAAAAPEKAEGDTNAFAAAMDASAHPAVGADGAGTSGTGEMSAAKRILANQAIATGVKH